MLRSDTPTRSRTLPHRFAHRSSNVPFAWNLVAPTAKSSTPLEVHATRFSIIRAPLLSLQRMNIGWESQSLRLPR